jgi:hypothetical protein
MKSFLMILALIFSSSVFCAEIKIYEAEAWRHDTAFGEFEFNAELGRAWVGLTMNDRYSNAENNSTEYVRVNVPGLSFDSTLNAAVLDINGQIIECAIVKQRGVLVFRHKYLKNTNCNFTSRVVKKMVDDGFEIKKVEFLQVFLVTKD